MKIQYWPGARGSILHFFSFSYTAVTAVSKNYSPPPQTFIRGLMAGQRVQMRRDVMWRGGLAHAKAGVITAAAAPGF